MTVWIYFLKARTINRIKIGQTRNLQQRLRSLECMNGDDVELLGVISDKCATESQLHRMFAKDRAQGEWFYPSKELLDYIQKNAVSDHPASLEQHASKFRKRIDEVKVLDSPYPGFPTLMKSTVPRGHLKAVPCDSKYLKSLDAWDLRRLRKIYGDQQVDDRMSEVEPCQT